jgi:hypothetical protein
MTTRFDGEILFLADQAKHTNPKVKASANGGFVLVYNMPFEESDVFVETRDALGRVIKHNRNVNQDFAGNQANADVVVLGNGNIVVKWEGPGSGTSQDIFLRTYDRDLNPISGEWNPHAHYPDEVWQGESQIVSLMGDRFAVAYKTSVSGGAYHIRIPIFNSDGSGVNTITISGEGSSPQDGGESSPKLVQTTDGRIVVLYQSLGDVMFNVYSANGVKQGETQALVQGVGTQFPAGVAALSDGSVAAVWLHKRFGEPDRVEGRTILGSVSYDFKMEAKGQVAGATIEALDNGRFVMAVAQRNTSNDNWVIRAQVFNANGTRNGDEPEIVVNAAAAGDAVSPDITVLKDGRFMISWSEVYAAGKMAAKAQIFDARVGKVSVVGTVSDDIYVATRFAGDEFFGGAGNDLFIDNSNGGSANEADIYEGGHDNDAVSYERAALGVVASLREGVVGSGAAMGDVFIGIEKLIGSKFNDTLYGCPLSEFLRQRAV